MDEAVLRKKLRDAIGNLGAKQLADVLRFVEGMRAGPARVIGGFDGAYLSRMFPSQERKTTTPDPRK